jgi:ubiquinone/menaquinone biosynthesis C-methylase UbiE
MFNKFDPKNISKLDNPGRINELRPRDIIDCEAGISQGMVCVDMGCGTGTFTFPMCELAGETGVVYGVDENPNMLESIRVKGLPSNLKLIQSDVINTGLQSSIADFCLLAFILHEVKQPQGLISEAFRLLKPGGEILIVEWKAELDSPPGPPRLSRLSQNKVESLVKKSGLQGIDFIDWSINYFIIKANKK